MDYPYFIGVLGAAMIMTAFFLRNMGSLEKETLYDESLNLLGATLLIIYAWDLQAWPFFVLNAIIAVWSAKVLLEKVAQK